MRQAEGMSERTEHNVNEDPREFWEELYAGAAPIWSGRVNRTLAEAVGDLPPGRSLDLGCGEGGDVLWLAERGWHATGIDLSETAVQRAREAARELGVADGGSVGGVADGSIDGSGSGAAVFLAADLADWVKTGGEVDGNPGSFDLITASFLQSPVELPRELILRAALSRLAPGGRLVLTSHAAPPPWVAGSDSASGHKHGHGSGGPKFFSSDDELEMLGLSRRDGSAEFVVGVAEIRKREVNDPEGRPALIDDSLVVVRRSGGAGEPK